MFIGRNISMQMSVHCLMYISHITAMNRSLLLLYVRTRYFIMMMTIIVLLYLLLS